MMERFIYADNAATTPVSPKVLEAMLPFYKEEYANPSSPYRFAQKARIAVEEARQKVADALGAAAPREIYFTSCGTESDNWAIKGAAHAQAKRGRHHIITTNFEHHAVLHTCATLEKEGFDVTYLPVDHNGLISPEDVEQAIREDTALVTIMYANNEIGTVLPIGEIGAVCRRHKVLFHTDAVQAIGNVAVDVQAQNIDLLSLSAHKLRAPKGVGALYVRKGVNIGTYMDGGAQEWGKRAGTENVAGIVGLGVAIEDAVSHLEENRAHKKELTDLLIKELLCLPHTRLNGDREHRLPGTVNISFEGVEGESLLMMLDARGICASSGSACTSGSLDPSHVLLAIGLPHEVAHGSLRLSFGPQNTLEDARYIAEVLPPVVERLRSMSPLWEKILAEDAANV